MDLGFLSWELGFFSSLFFLKKKKNLFTGHDNWVLWNVLYFLVGFSFILFKGTKKDFLRETF